MDVISQVKVFSTSAVGMGAASYIGSVQQVLTPDDTMLPVGVVVGLFVAAILATVKVVRLVDGMNRRLDEIEARMEDKR